MSCEVDVIILESKSNRIDVQLPVNDLNLDIMINIIQGMKKNNGGDNGQVIKQSNNHLIKQLNNDVIKSSDDHIIKKDSELEAQVKDLVEQIEAQKEDNSVTESIRSEPKILETEQDPDETLKRPSVGLDESLIKDKKEKKTSERKKGVPYALSDDQILVKNKDTETRSVSVYKPVIASLFKNLGDTFASKDISSCIFSSFRKDLKRKIKMSSARTYVADYRQYFLDMGFVEQVGRNRFRFTDGGERKRMEYVKKKREKLSDGELRLKFAGHKKNRIMEIRRRSLRNKGLVKSMPRKVS